MNLSNQKYEELLQLIYGVADREGSGWRDFLQQLTRVLDVSATQLIALDQTHQALSFSVLDGVAEPKTLAECELAYFQYDHTSDPRWQGFLMQDAETWYQCHEHIDDAYVATSDLYQNILLPCELRYIAAYKLYLDDTLCVALAIFTSNQRQPLTVQELDFINRLLPHLKRVVQLQKHLYRFSVGALVGYSLINKLQQPILLFSLSGDLIFCNPAANAFVASRGYQHANAILPELYVDDLKARLQRIEHDIRNQPLNMDPVDTDFCLRVAQSCGDSFYLFFSLMMPDQSMCVFGVRPLVMATLYHPNFSCQLDGQMLSNIFGFTPTECQIAMYLLEGLSTKEVAYKNQVRQDTVAKQLKSMYGKAGVHRQVDLIKLLLNLPQKSQPLLSE